MKTIAVVLLAAVSATLGSMWYVADGNAQELSTDVVALQAYANKLGNQLVKERVAHKRQSNRYIHMLRVSRRHAKSNDRFVYLAKHPTQKNNRELAKLLLSNTQFVAADQIAAGGDGIGGKPGESDWRENVWNGGKLGGDTPGPTARTCGPVGAYAYGIGQACPRDKMVAWAGTPAVYEYAVFQIPWMVHYGTGRYGSLEAAGRHWSMSRSW